MLKPPGDRLAAFPALVERALRYLSDGPADEGALARHLFGAADPRWHGLTARVLAGDPRFRRDGDGRWSVARERGVAEPIAPYRTDDIAPVAVGLVVVARVERPWRDGILAVAAARHGRWAEGDLEIIVRPPPTAPRIASRVLRRHLLEPEELATGQDLAAALPRICAYLGAHEIVGENIALAIAHLQFALRAHGLPLLNNTLRELGEIRVGGRGPSRPARERPLARARRFVGDATNLPIAPSATGAIHTIARQPLLDPTLLTRAPPGPGIYRFHDASGRILYVGKARSLRQRLANYVGTDVAATRAMPGLMLLVTRVVWEEMPCDLVARAREATILTEAAPPFNTQRTVVEPLRWADLALHPGVGVPRLNLRLSRLPFEGAVLARQSAARIAQRTARASWWPARLRKALRPEDDEVSTRFASVRAQFRSSLSRESLSGTLSVQDWSTRILLVETPDSDEARQVPKGEEETPPLIARFALQPHADGVRVAHVGPAPAIADGGGAEVGRDVARAALAGTGAVMVALDATGLTVIARAMARAAETDELL